MVWRVLVTVVFSSARRFPSRSQCPPRADAALCTRDLTCCFSFRPIVPPSSFRFPASFFLLLPRSSFRHVSLRHTPSRLDVFTSLRPLTYIPFYYTVTVHAVYTGHTVYRIPYTGVSYSPVVTVGSAVVYTPCCGMYSLCCTLCCTLFCTLCCTLCGLSPGPPTIYIYSLHLVRRPCQICHGQYCRQ